MQNFTVVGFDNPLHRPTSVEHCPAGQTVAQWLESTHYGTDIRATPTLILLNGEPLLEEQFGRVIEPEDIITVMPLPGWVVAVFVGLSLLASAASLYLALTAKTPEGIGKGSTTYDISYRGNRRKPGEPIPVVYGTMRTYPDITGSYTQYAENNDQWLIQIFDVSQGYCDINPDDIFYEDTPLSNFEEKEIEILHPGESSQLFPSEVFVSTEVSDIEPPDDPFVYTLDYTATPQGEKTSYLEVDFAAPQGVYNISTSGDLRSDLALISIRITETDSNGSAISTHAVSASMGGTKTTDPQRLTKRLVPSDYGMSSGYYTVAVARREQRDTRTRYNTNFSWTGLRGFSADKAPVTTTTRIALRVRQSQTVGNAALSKFNVLARRRLPDWSPGGGWTAPVQTNNAMAAFADILRADYGARMSDDRIDLAGIYDLAQRPLSVFNGVFDAEIDVWQAMNEVCAPLLARPLELPGGVFTAVADDDAVVPSAMFTMRNIVAGSFGIRQVGTLSSNNDSVRVTYNNEEEDYRQTTVLCVPFGNAGTNPKDILVRGVTSRDAAYEIGIRQANESKWRRKLVTFKTGVEGYLPHFGETLRIHHYLLGLEQDTPAISGEAKSHNLQQGSLTVYEDLSSLVGQPGLRVYLRNPDGSPFGPVTCTVPDAQTINFTSSTSGWVPQFGQGFAGPLYCVGESTDFMATVKVINVAMEENNIAQIEAVVDNPNVYIKGDPPAYSPIEIPQRLYPQVSNLTWGLYGDPYSMRVRLSWTGKHADYYLVQQSLDGGATWDGIFKTTEVFVTGTPPAMANYMVRVCGVALLQGPWQTLTINTLNYTLEPPPMARLRARDAFLGTRMSIAWDQGSRGFVPSFDVYWNGAKKATYTLQESATTGDLSYADLIQIEADTYSGLTLPKEGAREITVYGYFQNALGTRSKNPAVLTLKNPQIGALPNAGYNERGANLNLYFDMPDDGDFAWCEVYLSDVDGFTPNESTLVGRYTSNDITIIDSSINYGSTYYLRIVGVDVWGRDELTFSDQVTILTDDETIGGTIDYGNITGQKPPIDATRNKLWFQDTPPAGQDGDYWYDSVGGRLNQWYGGAWVAISTNIKTFSRPTAPSNPADSLVTGDMWYDSDSTNGDLYRWNGSAWQRVATERSSWAEIGDRPSDNDILNSLQEWDQVQGIGKPTDNATKNAMYKQATPPAGSSGDLWYCTQAGGGYKADVVYQHNGTTWIDFGNGFYDTTQLTDGQGLGQTADWQQIFGTGKPANDATKNTFSYGSTPPGTGTSGDLFMDSDTGLMYKWEAGAWKLVATSVFAYQQDNPPTNPKDGDMWYDTGADNPDKLLRRYKSSNAAWEVISSYGATWGSDLRNQPSDAALLNTLQEWDDIRDSSGNRPADKATQNRIFYTTGGGGGTPPILPSLQVQFPMSEASSGNSPTTMADTSGNGDSLTFSGSTANWRWTSGGAGNGVDFLGGYNFAAYAGRRIDTGSAFGPAMSGKGKFSAILVTSDITGPPDFGIAFGLCKPPYSLESEWSVAFGDAGGLAIIWGNASGRSTIFGNAGANVGRHVWHVVMDITNATPANRARVWKDGVEMTATVLSTGTEVPNYTSECWMLFGKGYAQGNSVNGKVLYGAIYDGTFTTQQIADSRAALAANDDINLLEGSGGGEEPDGANGDLWYNPDTAILQQHDGTQWLPVGNDFRDTLDLSDGAELGKNANWSKIFDDNGLRPENGATQNKIYYSASNPGTPSDGDMWYETDAGFLWKGVGGVWQKVATNTNIYRSPSQPPSPNIGDLWYDTDDPAKPLYRYDTDGWQKIATDGALWDDIPDKPELAEPVGDKGNMMVDGTLDKTAAAGDTDLNRYFNIVGSATYVKLYADATQRAFELIGSGNADRGVRDKKAYKVSKDQYLYVSFRAIKGGTAGGTNPQLRVGGDIYDKSGAYLGQDYFTATAANISAAAWQWYHGSFRISRDNSFAIVPGAVHTQATSGTIYVDDLYIGYSPARITSSMMPGYMDALTVDTLYIKDQAVTQAIYGYSQWAEGNFLTVTSTGGALAWREATSAPVQISAAGIPVIFNLQVEVGVEGVTQYTGNKYIRLLRNGVPIKTDRLYSSATTPTALTPGSVGTIFIDEGHSGGTVTYSVEIGVGPAGGTSTVTFAIRSLTITMLEAKK